MTAAVEMRSIGPPGMRGVKAVSGASGCAAERTSARA
jgi:hypothetical protein